MTNDDWVIAGLCVAVMVVLLTWGRKLIGKVKTEGPAEPIDHNDY